MIKKNSFNRLAAVFLIFLGFFGTGVTLFVPVGLGQDPKLECFSRLWPHEKSDLAPDPAVHHGKLDNGFRYILMNNDTPRDRVAIHFFIGAGSIHEDDDEKGYAHFLEHMLFNGTKHFSPGELVEYFQSLGMAFGADTNASTGYDRTIYTIVLPKGEKVELEKGFLVISDYAREALLLEPEVEDERGIILAEKLARDSVSYRMNVASRKNALQGTLLAEREPIGEVETIKAATGEALRSFYDKWYRPENMTLVVVGDIDKKEVEELITDRFTSIEEEGAPPKCPDFGELEKRGLYSFYYFEPDAGNVQMSIESYWDKEKESDSYEYQIQSLKEYISTMIVQRRLEKIAESETGLFSRPRAYSGNLLDRVGYSGLSAVTSRERWQESLRTLENVLRQALVYGITEGELATAKRELVSYFDSQAQKVQGRKSRTIAQQITWNLNNNRVFQSPEQEREIYVPAIEAFNVTDINSAFRGLMDRREKRIEVMGDVLIESENPEQYILGIYKDAEAHEVAQYVEPQAEVFPYAALEMEPVEPWQKRIYSEIDAESYLYENGVVLNLKKTDFKENEFEMRLEFGPGQQDEPQPGLAMVAKSVIARSGSGKLTESAIENALAGSSIEYNFDIETTQFVFSAKSLSEEAELLMGTLHTLFKDPGLREEAYRNTMVLYRQAYDSMAKDIRGAEELRIRPFFAGGNTLFGMPSWEEVSKVELPQIEKWIMPIFDKSTPRISVVGDFDKEEILNLVNRYFGTLPKGKHYRPAEEKIDFPEGENLEIKVPSQLDNSLVVFGWETVGFEDVSVVRRLGMLSSIFEDRIRLAIREKLGVAYSPAVYNYSSRYFTDYGVMYARLVVDEANIEAVKKAVLEISNELQQNGVQEEELVRARNPLMTMLRDRIRTNGYWLDTVLSQSFFYPEQLQWPTTIIEDNASITVEEMTAYAEKYLKPERFAIAVARPEVPAE
ncbi:M16 family metallopeptidase [Desulfopila inferna]|uniref:M16 family metallopeptidase n=1 Tax=Desulfopila inferna TaxID=468528 RepID=UPI001963E9F6|nr:M16 family metallopeptidase [Desulfopila inferna]MBM9603071.1 insulinase family protein [Desulfopila inferna]